MSAEISASSPQVPAEADVAVIIPARGGSKSIPRKNLMPVGGLPLVARSILAARQAPSVQAVYVTSDDAEILDAASAYGARPIRRPDELATDEASSEVALLHALDAIEQATGALPPITAFLQCTSPFTTTDHVEGLVRLIRDGADSALTVRRSHVFLWREGEGGAVGVNHDLRERLRRQDREAEFVETGAAYAFRSAEFRRHRHRFFGRVALLETPDVPAVELDDPDDVRLVEALLARG